MNEWPTPTPIPIPEGTPVLDLGIEGYQIAEGIVAGYQQLNAWNALDMFLWLLIVLIVIGGVWSVMGHLKRM